MKLIILDRDGVINKESVDYIRGPDDWHPVAGSMAAIAALHQAGYTICVATNQSGIGRGYFTVQTLEEIHDKLHKEVTLHGGKIHKIYYCPHTPQEHCHCRKPKTGMLQQLADDFGVTLKDLTQFDPIFVGDSLRDIELGLATGCRVFLVTNNDSHGQQTLRQLTSKQKLQINIVADLAEATRMILA